MEGNDIKSVVEDFWKKWKERHPDKIILAEILIPDKFHNECLKNLQSMRITHGKLFPDYAGAVDICKIDLDLDNKK